jgi:hypothetical protein
MSKLVMRLMKDKGRGIADRTGKTNIAPTRHHMLEMNGRHDLIDLESDRTRFGREIDSFSSRDSSFYSLTWIVSILCTGRGEVVDSHNLIQVPGQKWDFPGEGRDSIVII